MFVCNWSQLRWSGTIAFGRARSHALTNLALWTIDDDCRIDRKHTPGAKARFVSWEARPKAEALGYLEAKARTIAKASAKAKATASAKAKAKASAKAKATAREKAKAKAG